jgi:hypothetical protein
VLAIASKDAGIYGHGLLGELIVKMLGRCAIHSSKRLGDALNCCAPIVCLTRVPGAGRLRNLLLAARAVIDDVLTRA